MNDRIPADRPAIIDGVQIENSDVSDAYEASNALRGDVLKIIPASFG